jgi:hypothetical protein
MACRWEGGVMLFIRRNDRRAKAWMPMIDRFFVKILNPYKKAFYTYLILILIAGFLAEYGIIIPGLEKDDINLEAMLLLLLLISLGVMIHYFVKLIDILRNAEPYSIGWEDIRFMAMSESPIFGEAVKWVPGLFGFQKEGKLKSKMEDALSEYLAKKLENEKGDTEPTKKTPSNKREGEE